MNKVGRYLILLAILPLLASMAVSCVPAGPMPTGRVEVHVTDAPPIYDVTSIMVTVSGVEIHKAAAEQEQEQGSSEQEQEQQEQGGGGEWLPLDIVGDNPFDLLKIKGLDEVLATDEVEAGKYTQIRMTIEKVEVALGEGESQEATLPSGELKFVRPFDVVEGNTTVLLLDFDADKSVTPTGAGKVIVRPVVTLDITRPSE